MERVGETVDRYNNILDEADALRNELEELTEESQSLFSRILSLVHGFYGRNSSEYQRIGGTRPAASGPVTWDPEGGGEDG